MTRKIYIGICCLVLIISGVFYVTSNASGGDAGTIDDPLVTKSYMDKQIAEAIAQLKKEIEDDTNSNPTTSSLDMAKVYEDIDRYIATHLSNQGEEGDDSTPTDTQGALAAAGFVVEEVQAGSKVIFQESAEVILRAGEGTVISNAAGNGLADVTIGVDLSMGVVVPKNHLLIVPRSDGRGINITKRSFIMIKGGYTIEQQ